jgi:hypothetical protein
MRVETRPADERFQQYRDTNQPPGADTTNAANDSMETTI